MAISASGGVRRRLGRTLRRTRGTNGGTAAAPLQAIEENTVIDLTQAGGSTSSHFDKSPAPVKPKRSDVVKPEKPEKQEKEEKKETQQTQPPVAEKEEKTTGSKRRREPSVPVPETEERPSKSSRRGKATGSKSQKTSGKASANTSVSAAVELDRKMQRAAQLLEELEKQLDKRCSELLAEAERKSEELRMELKVQLMFLPESVRAMPWKTFIEDFGGSLENVIQGVKDQDYLTYIGSQQGMASPQSALKIRPAPSTVRSKDRRSNGNTPGALGHAGQASTSASSLASGLLTPSTSIRASISNYQTPQFTPSSNIPSTVIRTARKGEMTYSIRGSPIAPGSITKAPVGSLVATFQPDEAEPLACITLDNETALDLTNPELLNDETRAHARAKLEALQAKVNALLRQFK